MSRIAPMRQMALPMPPRPSRSQSASGDKVATCGNSNSKNRQEMSWQSFPALNQFHGSAALRKSRRHVVGKRRRGEATDALARCHAAEIRKA
jgi:hypothetical protein